MKAKITVLALIAVTAGVFAYTRPQHSLPADFRDAVSSGSPAAQLQGSVPAVSDTDSAAPAPPAPVSAEKEVYLDMVDGRQVEICENISESEVRVSQDCSSYFTGKHNRQRSEITKQVHSYDGLVDGFKDYVMVSGRLMRVYKLYANGTFLLDDPLGDGAGYYRMNVDQLEREVPAGEDWNGLKKGGTVCLKQDHEFDEDTADSGLFKPFPYVGMKGSRLVIENLFKSGFARVRTVSKTDKRILVRPVPLGLVEPCENK